MRRWLDPSWYGFLWQRRDRRGLFVVLAVLLLALGAGGYAAASSMKSGDTAVGVVKLQAIKRTVRVHGHEHVVTRYVTLSTTNIVRPKASTVVQTRIVTQPVVQTVHAAPVVRKQLVYVTGKGQTVTRQRVQTQIRTQTQTQTATQTNFATVTQPVTVVESGKTVTRRVTTTEPAQTVTVTGAIITVTQPAKTVTRTTTVTVTEKAPPPTTTTKP
jgi:hypothetical protein